MESYSELVIPFHKGREIRQQTHFIKANFNVKIEFTSNSLTAAQRSGSEWVKITGSKQARQNAQVFIKSIANPDYSGIYSIPKEIMANIGWIQQPLIYVQKTFLVSVMFIDETQLLLQGEQMAVVQAISFLETFINNTRQPMLVNTGLAYQSQGSMYHAQPYMAYYGQYPTGSAHYETPDGRTAFRNQDLLYKGAESMSGANLHSLGYHDQVLCRGMNIPKKQSEYATQPQNKLKMNENLRDYAQKLDYTDDEINAAVAKFVASGANQELDENSLLQHLIQLFPQKQPSLRSGGESTVVKDSTSNSASLQVHANAKEVSSDEKITPKYDGLSNQELRHIVVDGSNVAMSHGNKDVFSCKGIKVCVDFFKNRGHEEITVLVPQWRTEASKPDRPIEDQHILYELEKEQILSFTPSRRVNGQRVVCYDDRYIVKVAADNDGIIVSNDNFRDLVKENPEWKKVIEERLLMYTFVKGRFMPPDDPLGRRGPNLDTFLRKGTQANPRICPYMKKCTYGNKCKFYHPEKTQNLKEEAKNLPDLPGKPVAVKSALSDQGVIVNPKSGKQSETRHQKENLQGSASIDTSNKDQANAKSEEPSLVDANSLQAQLENLLTNRSEDIRRVIKNNPTEKDPNKLCDMVFNS